MDSDSTGHRDDFFGDTSARMREAIDLNGFHAELYEVMQYPRETLSASLMIRRDDGRLASFKAWRCRYNDVLGPTKGGVRFHPASDMREVMALGLLMTLKCATVSLPYGGGKGAVCVNVRELSMAELERLSRDYVRAFRALLGPNRDIPAPDMYTNERVMAWMADEYAHLIGYPEPAVITGKPVALGGIAGRTGATGLGAFLALSELQGRLDLPKKQRRFIVVGFGNAGARIAELLHADGWRMVGAADSSGAVHAPKGIDPVELKQVKSAEGSVTGAAGGGIRKLSLAALLKADCELLVPAATERQIDARRARTLGCRAILEVANGPVTAAADPVLRKRGIEVVPDILANSGGVIVSYYEWLQGRGRRFYSDGEVEDGLATRIRGAAREVAECAGELGCDLRVAAQSVALRRISAGIAARSVCPDMG